MAYEAINKGKCPYPFGGSHATRPSRGTHRRVGPSTSNLIALVWLFSTRSPFVLPASLSPSFQHRSVLVASPPPSPRRRQARCSRPPAQLLCAGAVPGHWRGSRPPTRFLAAGAAPICDVGGDATVVRRRCC
jgi:hypothetical protein